ncbi:patatin-like phospholipase family protein [Microvirga flavescens]|uniref:patatin-like phospholipase family protein n=1 Tax=Microvirga flavescens TaxID=2249811 RepID=UPI001FE10F45|nr:patatin-like phospholipase family protein [Microvirga flavescens]
MLRASAAVTALCVLSACALVPRAPYTETEGTSATLPGLPQVRRWADSPYLAKDAKVLAQKIGRNFNYLALSGGGGDGAYGAGVLNGWTAAGTRPQFDLVSGVSTGALIAPFAFLGPAYDEILRDLYTSGYAESLIESPNIFNVFFSSGLFGNERLLTLVTRYITDDLIAKVAEEHRKGRRLVVVTTNLDAQRPVLWDMGTIASAKAHALFREVMTASASVPGVFQPMLIDVSANGRAFQEMHVDGGLTSNIFTIPQHLLVRDPHLPGQRQRGSIYVLMNGKIEPSFIVVENSTAQIAGRAISTMTQAQSRSTLHATADFAQRNGFRFNITAIDSDMPDGGATGFETQYMRKLYEYGYAKGASQALWSRSVPLAAANTAGE